MRMIEKRDSFPEDNQEDMVNSLKLMISMIRHLVCIKRRARRFKRVKKFTLKNLQHQKEKKIYQIKKKMKMSSKFNTKKIMSMLMMRMIKDLILIKKRKNNQEQRKDNSKV